MNLDYYLSLMAKQKAKDLYIEIHGIDFDHRYNLYKRNSDLKVKEHTWNRRIVSRIKDACFAVAGKFFIHRNCFIKRNRT